MNIKAAWRATGIQPYNPNAVLQPLLQKLKLSQNPRSSDRRHMQHPTSTPSKFLAWQTPQNRRQLRHQTNAAIDMAKSGASAIDQIRKLPQQTEAAFARAEIAEIETANLRTKYAGMQARVGPGGAEEAYKRNNSRLGVFRKNGDRGERKGGSCGCKS